MPSNPETFLGYAKHWEFNEAFPGSIFGTVDALGIGSTEAEFGYTGGTTYYTPTVYIEPSSAYTFGRTREKNTAISNFAYACLKNIAAANPTGYRFQIEKTSTAKPFKGTLTLEYNLGSGWVAPGGAGTKTGVSLGELGVTWKAGIGVEGGNVYGWIWNGSTWIQEVGMAQQAGVGHSGSSGMGSNSSGNIGIFAFFTGGKVEEEYSLNGLSYFQSNPYPPWLNTPRGLNSSLDLYPPFTLSHPLLFERFLTAAMKPTATISKAFVNFTKLLEAATMKATASMTKAFAIARAFTAKEEAKAVLTKAFVFARTFTASEKPTAAFAKVLVNFTRTFTASEKPTSAFKFTLAKILQASLTASGFLQRIITSQRKGELKFSVIFKGILIKVVTAELKFTVAMKPTLIGILEASLAFSKTTNQKVKHQLAATLEFTKALATTQFKKLTSELKFTIVPQRIITHAQAAKLNLEVFLYKIRPRPLQAVLTFAQASLSKRVVVRNLQAHFEFLIKLRETTYKTLRAILTFTAATPRRITSQRKAQLKFSVLMKRIPVRPLHAALSFTQRTNHRIRKQAVASLTFAETEVRKIFGKRLHAILSFTGSVQKRASIQALKAKLLFVTLTTRKVSHQVQATLKFEGRNGRALVEFVQKLIASMTFTVKLTTVKTNVRKVLEAFLHFHPELDMQAYETKLQNVGPYTHVEVGTSELVVTPPTTNVIIWVGRTLQNKLSLYPSAKFKKNKNEFAK